MAGTGGAEGELEDTPPQPNMPIQKESTSTVNGRFMSTFNKKQEI
jgi:hypothetical protein